MKPLLSYLAGVVTGLLLAALAFFAYQRMKPSERFSSSPVDWSQLPPDQRPELGDRGNSMSVDRGKMVLISTAQGAALLDFTSFEEPAAANYRWRYRPANGEPEQSGTGRVFENYQRIPTGPESVMLKNNGGELIVRAGPIHLEWSYHSGSSVWIYFNPEQQHLSLHDNRAFAEFDLRTSP